MYTANYSQIMNGLVNAPNLRMVTVPIFFEPQSLRSLAENNFLRAIYMNGPDTWRLDQEALMQDPKLKELLVFEPVES
jgi:hypothetical protein